MKLILGCDSLLMPLTGIGHYTRQLGNAYLCHRQIDDVKLYAHGVFHSLDLLKNKHNLAKNDPMDKSSVSFFQKARGSLAKSQCAVNIYASIMPYVEMHRLRNCKSYVYHSPNFIMPNFLGKTAVTIHDLSVIRFPDFHPSARVSFVKKQIENVVRKADVILADSYLVADEIESFYPQSIGRVKVAHLAADPSFMPRTEFQCNDVLEQFDLAYQDFFLFVSTIEPRKNIQRLLDAYEIYRNENLNGKPLVMVGGAGWNNHEINEKIKTLQLKGWLKTLGYLSNEHIHQLYSASYALLFPSIYEGFGLPALEAMQSGTMVLTSRDSSMSEFCQDAAVYCDPMSTNSIADQICQLSNIQGQRESFIQKGLLLASKLSWKKTAQKNIELMLDH